ncbi:hypothetical protein M0802_003168 [Mischocyttarus mexicanus]|nr:hypothetical protein M0802_003168 [Mischocyttarus mexicanus]
MSPQVLAQDGRAKLVHFDTIFLRYYNNTLVDYVDEKLDNIQSLIPKMDKNKPTVLYIHGYKETVEKQSVSTIVCAYLQRNDHNILAVDYRNISYLNYLEVAFNAKFVGRVLALALNKMVVAGFNSDSLHVVGHSMGSQIAGHIGELANFKLPRITGLDPAGPLFNIIGSRLTSAKARFVDIIHTDYGFYGISKTTGTVDFFPNGGHRLQPGCKAGAHFLSEEDFCSHSMSWKFYALSLIEKNALIAVQCFSYHKFLSEKCKENVKAPMGFETRTNTNGTFYLTTNIDTLSPLNALQKCMGPIKHGITEDSNSSL